MKKLIGISIESCTESFGETMKVDHAYVDAVLRCGHLPILIPYFDVNDISAYLQTLDGLILTGGIDVNPLRYEENPTKKSYRFDDERDAFEAALLLEAKQLRLPTLAICRGLQIANVTLGGSLHQDIETNLPDAHLHTSPTDWIAIDHFVNVEKNSILHRIFRERRIVINSLHHQAIHRLAKDLRITATGDDGIIEAVEYKGDWYFHAVQFHPERLRDKPEFLAIFKDLMEVSV